MNKNGKIVSHGVASIANNMHPELFFAFSRLSLLTRLLENSKWKFLKTKPAGKLFPLAAILLSSTPFNVEAEKVTPEGTTIEFTCQAHTSSGYSGNCYDHCTYVSAITGEVTSTSGFIHGGVWGDGNCPSIKVPVLDGSSWEKENIKPMEKRVRHDKN